MKAKQTGFTLIELIMVIVILGILAATAMPKFVDMKTEAATASAAGIAGAMAADGAINYAAQQMTPAKGSAAPADCAAWAARMNPAVDTTKFTIAGTVAAGCTVTSASGGTAASTGAYPT